jgi:hypothetical protein
MECSSGKVRVETYTSSKGGPGEHWHRANGIANSAHRTNKVIVALVCSERALATAVNSVGVLRERVCVLAGMHGHWAV